MFYVADKFPRAGLIPSDAIARAEMYRWIFFAVSEIEPHLWAIAQHRFALPEDKRVPALEPTAAWQLARALRAIEKRLAHAPYMAGDDFSLADILCFHCLTWTLSAKLDGVGEASIAYVGRLRSRPALQRANDRERIEAERHEAQVAAGGA
jgi:glutathione S-transferase